MICQKCGTQLSSNAEFCNNCGARIKNNSLSGANYSGNYSNSRNTSNMGKNIPLELQDIVVDRNEKYIDGLKDSVGKTFVSGGGFGKNLVFFTNKRFYVKTSDFSLKKGIITDNFVIDTEDITGVDIVHSNPIQWIILAALALIAMMISSLTILGAIVFGILYFLRKGTYLEVAYPGGKSLFSVKMYRYNTVLEFQKKLNASLK